MSDLSRKVKTAAFVKDLFTVGKIVEFTAFHFLLLICELLFSRSTS